jgi:hypothetical protein
MEVEEAEWHTPKRRKAADLTRPGKLVSPETSTLIVSKNPFTPLVRVNSGGCDTKKSPKAERSPPIFIKNVKNINPLLKQITGVNPGEFCHSTNNKNNNKNNLKLIFKTT